METNVLLPEFTIQSTRAMVVRLVGRSPSDDAQLKDELMRVCTNSPQLLVLDLSKLLDINSAVLGVLLLCRRLTTASNGVLRLAGVQPAVMDVLRHSGLSVLFDCRATVDAALVGDSL